MSILTALLATAHAEPPPPDLGALAGHERRTGTWMTAGGLVAAGGGVAIMSVGRGRSGEISTESLLESDLRSVGGGILLIGGITSTIIGVQHFAEAHSLRREERGLTLSILPTRVSLSGRF